MYRTLSKAGILCAAFAAGCGSSSTGPALPANYVPVALGNQWDYQLEGSAYSTADQDTLQLSGTTSRMVTGGVIHEEGFSLFTIRDITETILTTPDTSFAQIDTAVVFYYLSDTELRVYDDTVATEYEVALLLPITSGDSWTPDSNEPDITREVVSVSETVTVPAGTWQGCALLRDTDSGDPESVFDFYLASGIGPVLYSILDVEAAMTWEMELSLTASVIN